MKRLRWQLAIIFLTGLVVGILLLGEQPIAQPLLRPEPVQGGTYTEALIGDIQRLNPVLDHYNSVDRDVDKLIFCSLVVFDERGLPLPGLAESWGISQDGTIYNFTLRPDINWHDGQPVTSRDIVFTLDIIRDGGLGIPEDIQTFWKDIEVKDLGDQNLQFQLPDPFAPFLDFLTVGVLPEHLLGGLTYDQIVESSFNIQPVGCGPFRFDSLIIENNKITGVVLTAFEEFYGKRPYIDKVVFRYYPDEASALQAYRNGVVQGISRVSQEILPLALQEPDLSIYTGRKPEISMILFNLDNAEAPFFEEIQIRKALMMGLNRQWMIDRILMGQAIITDTPILPGTWAYYEGQQSISFDTEQAIEILKEAGYLISSDEDAVRKKDETILSFTLLYPEDDLHRTLAEAIQKDWLKLNINVETEGVPYDQLVIERLGMRDYQAALIDLNLARSPDPDPYPFWNQVQSVGGQNYSQWDNKIASEYIEQARVSTDFADRTRLYHNFQVIFSQELPALPLFNPVYNYAVDKQIRGVRVGPIFDTSDRFNTILDWYLEARIPSSEVTPTILE